MYFKSFIALVLSSALVLELVPQKLAEAFSLIDSQTCPEAIQSQALILAEKTFTWPAIHRSAKQFLMQAFVYNFLPLLLGVGSNPILQRIEKDEEPRNNPEEPDKSEQNTNLQITIDHIEPIIKQARYLRTVMSCDWMTLRVIVGKIIGLEESCVETMKSIPVLDDIVCVFEELPTQASDEELDAATVKAFNRALGAIGSIFLSQPSFLEWLSDNVLGLQIGFLNWIYRYAATKKMRLPLSHKNEILFRGKSFEPESKQEIGLKPLRKRKLLLTAHHDLEIQKRVRLDLLALIENHKELSNKKLADLANNMFENFLNDQTQYQPFDFGDIIFWRQHRESLKRCVLRRVTILTTDKYRQQADRFLRNPKYQELKHAPMARLLNQKIKTDPEDGISPLKPKDVWQYRETNGLRNKTQKQHPEINSLLDHPNIGCDVRKLIQQNRSLLVDTVAWIVNSTYYLFIDELYLGITATQVLDQRIRVPTGKPKKWQADSEDFDAIVNFLEKADLDQLPIAILNLPPWAIMDAKIKDYLTILMSTETHSALCEIIQMVLNPQITIQPQHQIRRLKERACLSMTVTGASPMRFAWERKSSDAKGYEPYNPKNPSNIIKPRVGTRPTVWNYRGTATNHFGSQITQETSVIVLHETRQFIHSGNVWSSDEVLIEICQNVMDYARPAILIIDERGWFATRETIQHMIPMLQQLLHEADQWIFINETRPRDLYQRLTIEKSLIVDS